MKLKSFMSIAAIIVFVFGLAFLLVPVQTLSVYGITLDISGQIICRYWGSTFFGISVLIWFARNANPQEKALRAIILGAFILCLTGFTIALYDVFFGAGNYLVWSSVLIYFLLALGWGNFLFRKSAAQKIK